MPDHSKPDFTSDNYAGAHPEMIEAIAAANTGHAPAYGDDDHTERLQQVVRSHFGQQAQAYPVFNGSGANFLALTSVLPRWGVIVTTETAHIHTDEHGALERLSGLRLQTVPAADGRLTPELVAGAAAFHDTPPAAVSITQVTELGTVYSVEQVRAISEAAHQQKMAVHMDGARIGNAAAALGVGLREFTTEAGVDILSFGGTKNGMLFGEAVIVLNPDASAGLVHLRKLSMQLASKMRYISAQLNALLEGDLWLRSASHANSMAARLRAGLEALALPQLGFTHPTEANAVFATLPAEAIRQLRERYDFYDWDPARGEVRWMTAWDTTPQQVDEFVAAVAAAVTGPAGTTAAAAP